MPRFLARPGAITGFSTPPLFPIIPTATSLMSTMLITIVVR